ncbi:hypothetical protein DTO013E5_6521 [Penicillium roqueforti]|uniref:Anaphase-promoting complex, subunit 10 n=1 Tax=Penicillium roqueforti (strain FM164) TaxID=1365484 RepID=W6QPL8_PENRF|nr:uncharacterized protein LCP9604111_4045 [Penicillium roqueforti]CDM38345.1 Anaphase-promoting complex, subunit 10 [Penicillium roqueforti FM164]KAF9249945.1 hypothetical protein LCP9604111_4045 [Penicillium roqueforti]KAI1837198.1 hypothetical protein CBS147337_2450 [Penicillium roqueforti]KAI2673784.1 hypothetical protein CBS147355_7543 [Penicillium roqueforti]KAI2684833.1 hypothetical protein LCP963914a_4925 [Penicillium roqueforti]
MALTVNGNGAPLDLRVNINSKTYGTTMPHLRRQPNPRDTRPNQDNAPGNLRAQFQTPPTRHTPTNPTHRHQPPSTGLNDLTPDPVAVAGHPAAPINPFTIFGRPRARVEQLPPQMMDDDDFDDDFDPRGHNMQELGNDGPLDFDDSFDQAIEGQFDDSDIEDEELEDEAEDQFDEEDPDQEMHDREKSPSPLPPNLREISSLASWTVSTSKPGCGVAALRNPSPAQYWQSDGPQPHTLTLHFFKLVAVVRIRVYLDFELDESYTPTKMIFAAGMGGNDLIEFATWEGDGPCGWVNVPLEGVGGRNGGWVRNDTGKSKRRSTTSMRRRTIVYRNCDDPGHEHDDECDPFYEIDEPDSQDDGEDPYSGNVLKAMVIQMRIMENHQNGKDTHVRGFQVFACDDSRRKMAAAPSASADARRRRPSLRGAHDLRGRTASEDADTGFTTTGLDEPDWMGEPVIR